MREAGGEPLPLLPPVDLDPEAEVVPHALFRDLREGRSPLLVDLRPGGGTPSFAGSVAWPGAEWEPPADRDTVLVDGDGSAARELARGLRRRGHGRVWSLYGGIRLYDFALDPRVVGEERFLR